MIFNFHSFFFHLKHVIVGTLSKSTGSIFHFKIANPEDIDHRRLIYFFI